MKSDNFDSDTKTSVIDIETYNTRIKNQSQKKSNSVKRQRIRKIPNGSNSNTNISKYYFKLDTRFFPCIVRSIKYEVIILLVKAN